MECGLRYMHMYMCMYMLTCDMLWRKYVYVTVEKFGVNGDLRKVARRGAMSHVEA